MEILIIALLAVLLFGAKKLPELARGLGESLNEFRKAREEGDLEAKLAEAKLKEAQKMEAQKKADLS